MPITMSDYERRFQRSLQKLTVPTWYAEAISSSQNSTTNSKQSLTSTTTIPWKTNDRESSRTPEIMHVRRPYSYRSCRSSLATSPSPSMHSWHPNHMIEGMNFSLLIPSSSSSSSRRPNKYQKGIERVSKSSRWYQPTSFLANNSTHEQTGIIKVSTATKQNHYDTPNIRHHSPIATLVDEHHYNVIPIIEQEDNQIKFDESEKMPLVNLEQPFGPIELAEITTGDEQLLERTANDLVESVLADILCLKNLDEFDDQNSGVRELSEDENGLRELDENDMNDTDEFIVFATQPETSDHSRYNLNKLFSFSKPSSSNQNSPRSIIENDVMTIHSNTQDSLGFNQFVHTSPIYHLQSTNLDRLMCSSNSQLVTHQSSEEEEGVNEETARIGRILLERISIPFNEHIHDLSPTSTLKNIPFVISEQDDYHRPMIEEYDHEFRPDSAYSSNQGRIHIQHSIYEPLSECYSGYSFIQSDFLTPNISSIQSTTDEAYESEPTTMSSSIAMTNHVHPDLEHEFDFPSPPPPVPDRRLKPAYLKVSPPPTKPRLTKQDTIDSTGYSIIQKSKPLSVPTIEQFLRSTSDDLTSPSTRTMSSRHYCGLIPAINEEMTQSSINSTPMKINEHSKDKTKDKRNSRTLNCLNPSTTDDHQKRNVMIKSSSSLNKSKMKKQKRNTDFDEATNGLAIRLPASISDGTKSPNRNRTSTPLSTKRATLTTHKQPSFYETSV